MIPRYHDLPAWWWPLAAAEGSVLLHSAKPDTVDHVSWLYTDPAEELVLREASGVEAYLAGVDARRRAGAWLAGYVAYEAGYPLVGVDDAPELGSPLAWLGVYEGAWRFDHRTGETSAVGQTDRGDVRSPKDPGSARLELGAFGLDETAYRNRLARIHTYLAAGDTYQVNFTDRFEGTLHGEPIDAYRVLAEGQPVSFGAYLNTGGIQIASLSPELFIRVEAGARRTITARPMKGTAPRGRDAAEDRALADALRADEKTHAENVMIVDLLRNDLGRICEHGSVRVPRLFDVERYRTVQQMTSTVQGGLREDVGLAETFRALFPCGSVTGAPKRRTMEIVRELERVPRGVYTGAIGHAAPDGSMAFSVAIRTLVMEGNRVTLGAGGGIVADSDPADEYRECGLKARFATQPSEPFKLIETLRWEDGYPFLAAHLERLAASAEYFGFAHDGEALERALEERGETFPPGVPHRVGVRLSASGDVRIAAEPLPEAVAEWRRKPADGMPAGGPPGASTPGTGTPGTGMPWADKPGVGKPEADTPAHAEPVLRVAIASARIDSSDPFLRHKTTRRALYEAATAEARERGLADLLFLNERGELAEGAISNVFVEIGGELLTPPLDAGALPGVYRGHLLATDPRAREARIGLEDLERADAIWLANALRGLRKVALVGREAAAR